MILSNPLIWLLMEQHWINFQRISKEQPSNKSISGYQSSAFGHAGQNIPIEAQLCPGCHKINKTQKHYMECDNQKQQWETAVTTILSNATQHSIDPKLLQILKGGLEAGRQSCIVKSLRWLQNRQASDGNSYIMADAWSTKWADIQEQRKTDTGEWVRKVIIDLLTEHHKIWIKRCNAVHE